MDDVLTSFGDDNLLLDDDHSWSFPILLSGDQNEGFDTIFDGKTKVVSSKPAPSLEPKGKKKSAASNVSKRGGGSGGGAAGGGEGDDHEGHIWTERERRKKMRDLFANLHALIPHLPPRADKFTIVDEAVNHIQKLQETLEHLEKRKAETLKTSVYNNNRAIQSREAFLAKHSSMTTTINNGVVALAKPPSNMMSFSVPDQIVTAATFKTWTSSNVILNVCGKDAHISICGMRKPGLLTAICFVMEKYKIDVVTAQVSSVGCRRMYMIHARATSVGFPDQNIEALNVVEEMYKQAAAEIMMWVNNAN